MPLRILIADDSATNRMLFSTTAHRLGHQADVAVNGEEALALFASRRYDLVFLDLTMPVMNGIETARALQRINPRHTPVYAISGYPAQEMAAQFSDVGIRRCLIKPLDREKLHAAARECGLDSAATAPASGETVPRMLIGTYAHELRSRGQACLRYLQEGSRAELFREAHTIRALAQMLKTQDVEEAALRLEQSCRLPAPEKIKLPEMDSHTLPLRTKELAAACARAAGLIERHLPPV